MVKVRRFAAHLANKDFPEKVIAPAYDTLNTAEARLEAEGNPSSFLHCNKPEIDLPVDTDPYHKSVYLKGRDNLQHFIKEGYLVQDDEATFYIYQQTMEGHSQRGIMGLASIQDYETQKIKRHEFTLAKKEEDRTKLTDVQNANMGPVFLTFRDNQEAIRERIDKCCEIPCYGDVTSDDGVQHVLWRCTPDDADFFEAQFAAIDALYVCDGHHRTQSAYNVGKLRREKYMAEGREYTGEEPFNYFMTLFYPADNLKILDYNRVLKTLEDHTTESFMEALSQNFDMEKLAEGADTHPNAPHKFNLLIENEWYSMNLKPEKLDTSTPITQLDAQILTDLVFEPLIGIKDLKKDNRIDFVGGIRGHKELERRCQLDCKCAIAMYPCSLTELMNVADANLIMPPKSTWFEPKPRSGFVVRVFEGESVLIDQL